MRVTIYTDGAAKGNPDGPGGFGAVLVYVDPDGVIHEKSISDGFRKTTNNRMELMAAIEALKCLERPCDVDIYSDSSYLVNAFEKGWIKNWVRSGWKRGKNEPVKNVDLWEQLLCVMRPHNVKWHWVRGHSGNTYNERCDTLASDAAKQPTPKLRTDPGCPD